MTKQATIGPIDPSVNSPLNRLAPNKALLGKFALILWNEHQGIVADRSSSKFVSPSHSQTGVQPGHIRLTFAQLFGHKLTSVFFGFDDRIKSQFYLAGLIE